MLLVWSGTWLWSNLSTDFSLVLWAVIIIVLNFISDINVLALLSFKNINFDIIYMEPHTQCTVYWISWWWQEVVILEWHVNHFGMVILTFGFDHSLSHRYELSAQTRGIIRGPYHPTSRVLNIWIHTVGCWKIQEFVSYTLNFACFSIKKRLICHLPKKIWLLCAECEWTLCLEANILPTHLSLRTLPNPNSEKRIRRLVFC